MALEHTLLGLLMLQPRSGYDLYKRVESAEFLLQSASLRRIYPSLKRLAEERMVTFEVVPQEGKPDRKVYSVTDAGEAAFLDWLGEPPLADGLALDNLLAKLFFGGMLDGEVLLGHLCHARDERQRLLTQLDETQIAPPVGPCRPMVDEERVTAVWHRMLDYGRAQTRTQIRWLDEVIGAIEDHAI